MKRKMSWREVETLVAGFLEDNANFQIFALQMGFTYEGLKQNDNPLVNGLLEPFLKSPQGLSILEQGLEESYHNSQKFFTQMKEIFAERKRTPPDLRTVEMLISTFLYDNANFQIYAVNKGYTFSDLAAATDLPDDPILFSALFHSPHGVPFLKKADQERDRWEKILSPEKNEEESKP